MVLVCSLKLERYNEYVTSLVHSFYVQVRVGLYDVIKVLASVIYKYWQNWVKWCLKKKKMVVKRLHIWRQFYI
jgi:hypothetical protein